MSQMSGFQPSGQPVCIHCRNSSDDLYHGLLLQQKAHGQGKRIFQMVLAIVLAVVMFASWLRDRTYTMGFVLGTICILLFLSILLLPGYIMKHTAMMLAENYRELEFQIFENGALVFDGLAADALPSSETAVYEDNQMFLFETKGQRVYPIPKRMVEPLDLKVLKQFFKEYPSFYPFIDAEISR
jgi:hypothetical protein